MKTLETDPRLLLDIVEVCHRLSVGRTTVYKLMAGRDLRIVKIGRRSLVAAESLTRYVDGLGPRTDASEPPTRA